MKNEENKKENKENKKKISLAYKTERMCCEINYTPFLMAEIDEMNHLEHVLATGNDLIWSQ